MNGEHATLPQELGRNGKEKHVHAIYEIFSWQFWAYGRYILRKMVILQVDGVSVMQVEVFDEAWFSSP